MIQYFKSCIQLVQSGFLSGHINKNCLEIHGSLQQMQMHHPHLQPLLYDT